MGLHLNSAAVVENPPGSVQDGRAAGQAGSPVGDVPFRPRQSRSLAEKCGAKRPVEILLGNDFPSTQKVTLLPTQRFDCVPEHFLTHDFLKFGGVDSCESPLQL